MIFSGVAFAALMIDCFSISDRRDYQRLCMDLARQFQLPQAFDCVFKIRCSRGFTVSKILAAASAGQRDISSDFSEPSQFRLPRIDGDQTLAFEIKHEGE